MIGTEVFGREPSYDTKADPVVRTEARRLRARLAKYYDGPGAGDTLVIDLPKGGYVPVIRLALDLHDGHAVAKTWFARLADADRTARVNVDSYHWFSH